MSAGDPLVQATLGAPACPACGNSAAASVGRLEIAEQMRIYAQHDEVTARELLSRLGLAFAAYDVMSCQECGLQFSEPPQAPTGEWYAYAYGALALHAGDRWEFDYVARHVTPDESIGEIGCGRGLFLEKCRVQGLPAFGIDFSESSIRACQEQGLGASAVDINDPQLAGLPFTPSVVVSFHVLEHLERPAQLFELAGQWLRADGTLWVSVPSDRCSARLVGPHQPLDEPPHHLTRWTGEALRRIGARHGWQLCDLIYERLSLRQRLWILTCQHGWYAKLCGLPGLRTRTADRLLRYTLYPSVALANWRKLQQLTGLSMLARFTRSSPATPCSASYASP